MPENIFPSTELFRFTKLRNPDSTIKVSSSEGSVSKYKKITTIHFDSTFGLPTSLDLYTEMKGLAENQFVLSSYSSSLGSFKASQDFLSSRESINSLIDFELRNLLLNSSFSTIQEVKSLIEDNSEIDFSDESSVKLMYNKLWENLIYYALLPSSNETMVDHLSQAIQDIELAKEIVLNTTLENNQTIENFVSNVLQSSIAFPKDVVPYKFNSNITTTAYNSAETERYEKRLQYSAGLKLSTESLFALNAWRDNIFNTYNASSSGQMNGNVIPDYELANKLNNPDTDPQDTELLDFNTDNYNIFKTLQESLISNNHSIIQQTIVTQAKLDSIKQFAKLPELQEEIKAFLLIVVTDSQASYSFDYVSKRIVEMGKSSGDMLSTYRPKSFLKQGIIQGTLIEETLKDYSQIEEDTITTQDELCTVKFLGVSDLLRVEQKLLCYEPGEIAHIENIMSGEERKRSTRRLNIRETENISEIEKETVDERDLQTTERFEMESESSKTASQSTNLDVGLNVVGDFGIVDVSLNTNFSMANSSTESRKNASRFAKEVVEKTKKKVSEKTKTTSRIRILEEFEEKNEHNFKNETENHTVGVYRWLDKIYQAKLLNYGLRSFVQFMVPEPASFYIQNMMNAKKPGEDILKPIAPDDKYYWKYQGTSPLNSFSDLNRFNYQVWAAYYDASGLTAPPEEVLSKTVAETFTIESDTTRKSGVIKTVVADEGYFISDVWLNGHLVEPVSGKGCYININMGHAFHTQEWGSAPSFKRTHVVDPWLNETNFEIGYTLKDHLEDRTTQGHLVVQYHCRLSNKKYDEWRMATYDAIIQAYLRKKSEYEQSLSIAEYKANNFGTNPKELELIQKRELKRACLESFLNIRKQLGPEAGCFYNWGTYGGITSEFVEGCSEAGDFVYPSLKDNCTLNQQGSDIMFFEQAIDWKNMTYVFYPYFWGRKCNWKLLSTINNEDPLFNQFLQSGEARVIVPITPGMESAVMNYMKTGKVWNGSSMPVIGDALYVDIIEEIKKASDYPENPKCVDTWTYKLPTSLVILQSQANPVEVDKTLPCHASDPCVG